MWAKQSTAATLIVGPILDSAGAEYAGAVIGDLSLSKNGGTLTALASAASLTHIANGQYTLVLTTGNVDTLGRAQITCNKSTYQMPEMRLMVVPATVFDALVTNAVNATGGFVGATGAITGLAGVISTYTGGDTSGTTTLLSRLTSTRAGLLDNLSNLDASISGLNNLSALANLYASPLMEIPDSGTTLFAFTLVTRDNEGKLKDLDSSPTITAANAAGTDRSANLSAVSHPGTGRYTWTYSVSSAAAEESLRVTCSGVISGEARYVEWIGSVVNYDTLTILAATKANTDTLVSALPISGHLAGSTDANGAAVLNSAYSDQFDAIEAAVDANTGYLTALTTNMTTLLGRVTSQVYTMWTDLITMITGSGSTPKFTTSALSNAPTGSGGGGGGQAPTIVTLQAVAGISPGVIVGPTEPLVIGDDYLTVMNRSVRINLLDKNGDPAEVDYGTYALDDSGISIYLLLARSGKPSVEAQIFGTCTFFPAEEVDSVLIPPYLIVEFTKAETAKAVPGAYDMQAEAVWQDGKVVTFAPYGQIQFVRDIRRA